MNFENSINKHVKKLVGALKSEEELQEVLKRKFTKKEYKIFVDPKYIYYYVQTLTEKLLIEAGKTTFPFLSTSKLANFLIPVGPLTEQLRVIYSIEELMPEIDKLNKVCS